MAGETRRAVLAQPEWLRQVPTSKQLPAGARVVFTGCGTSFHAAQTGGWAVEALEAVIKPPLADIMVCVSHEGGTALTMEAEQAFGGDVWLVTGNPESELAERADEVIVATPQIERSWCHTASYTCAVAAIDALNGEEIDWLPEAVEQALLDKGLAIHDHSLALRPYLIDVNFLGLDRAMLDCLVAGGYHVLRIDAPAGGVFRQAATPTSSVTAQTKRAEHGIDP